MLESTVLPFFLMIVARDALMSRCTAPTSFKQQTILFSTGIKLISEYLWVLKDMDVHSLKLTASSDLPEKPKRKLFVNATTFRCYVSVQGGQSQLIKKLAVQVTKKFE